MPTRIGERIAQVLTHSTISQADVQDLISTAKSERKLTPELKAEVAKLLAQPADKFDAGAKEQLQTFLTGAVAKKDVADPGVLTKDATSIAWNPVGPDGKLFVDGVSYDDVVQGSVANCYMVSAFSALAQVSPDVIQKAIKDNGDGTYTVRFYDQVNGRMKPVSVTVDDDLPSYGAGSAAKYAHARDGNEEWVSILEKAYAQWKGGYDAIGNGGRAGDVFQALTGKPYGWASTSSTAPDALFKQIQTATQYHRPITAGTFGKDAGVDYTGTGVYAWHSYTVLGASEENGTKYVQLRNPWGHVEPGSDGKDDGIFKMKLSDFTKLYQTVYLGG